MHAGLHIHSVQILFNTLWLLGLAIERTVDGSLQCISERKGGSSLQRAAGGRMSQAEQNAERQRLWMVC